MLTGWEAVDAHFERLWEAYAGGLRKRGRLSERRRTLALLGVCVALDDPDALERLLRPALAGGHATPRELFEVVLCGCIYVGKPRVDRAAERFLAVLEDAGRGDALGAPPAGDPPGPGDAEIPPGLEPLVERYGAEGIRTGLRLQPAHHERSVRWLDGFDQEFTRLWLGFIFAGMYRREVLDPVTRTLVMIAYTVAAGELNQAENHMRNALTLGATDVEIAEVLLQSVPYLGFPPVGHGIRVLQRIRAD